ncbi:ribonuclease H-like domain-containing protein, partial [Tanacetum coccineum]
MALIPIVEFDLRLSRIINVGNYRLLQLSAVGFHFTLHSDGDYEMWKLRIEQHFQVQDYALWEPCWAILSENISPEDLNLKFLRSLPAEWNTYVVVWRNKPDLDTMRFDDLYNNFKIVKQEVKRTVTSSSNSSSQNMAFVSSPSNTNDVNTANVQVSAASTPVSMASSNENTANLSDATIYAFLANQPNGSQLVHEDLNQIHEDDLEEMDLKWQLALLSMRARRFYQRTGKKITINGSDTTGYEKSKVECFNCHKMGHFARECRSPRNQDNRPKNQDSSRKTVNVEETSSKAIVAIDGAGFDWSFMSDEEVPTNMALMAFSNSEVLNDKTCTNTCLKNYESLKTQNDNLRIELNKSKIDLATYIRGLASVEEQLVFYKKNEIEKLKKEKEINQIKIDNFENASKSLDKLIGSQISDNSRKEFQQPLCLKLMEFKSNKSVCENSFKEIKKTPDALITEDWVSDCDKDERNFAPTAVLTKSGLVPISVARQTSSKAATPVSAARPIITAIPKPFVNAAKPRPNAFQKHMTGNKSYLTDYQDYDGGFVTFAGSSKGGRITGKGKIRTGKLDFEDVYFLKELKFNLFSVSQMCDRKNSVLFTETKCLILSLDFKLPDESQVLLKVPRKNNMYSFDLKNVVPSKVNTVDVTHVGLHHITNGHQFTMSNRQEELAIPWQTETGKEFSNPLMAVNTVKQIHVIVDNKAVVISESSVRSDLLFDDEDAQIEPILPSPTTYQQKRKTHKCRRTKKDTKLPQTSVPQDLRADEAAIWRGDSVERAITTGLEWDTVSSPRTKTSHRVIIEDKGSGEKDGSTADQFSTARPDVSAATPTTTTIFDDDEDLTIAQTLVKMKITSSGAGESHSVITELTELRFTLVLSLGEKDERCDDGVY